MAAPCRTSGTSCTLSRPVREDYIYESDAKCDHGQFVHHGATAQVLCVARAVLHFVSFRQSSSVNVPSVLACASQCLGAARQGPMTIPLEGSAFVCRGMARLLLCRALENGFLGKRHLLYTFKVLHMSTTAILLWLFMLDDWLDDCCGRLALISPMGLKG